MSPLYCTYFKSSGCCCRLPEMKWSVTNHFKTIKIMSIARLNSLAAAAARPFLDGIKIIILGLRDKIYVHWSRYKYKSRGGASQEKCWDGFSIFDRYISTYFVLLCAYRITTVKLGWINPWNFFTWYIISKTAWHIECTIVCFWAWSSNLIINL